MSGSKHANETLLEQIETQDDALIASTSNAPLTEPSLEGTSPVEYKTYKRRWFGLVQLILLNIVISWSWLSYSPVVNDAATFFQTTPSVINWLSTAFLFAFCVAAPVALYAIYHRGAKFAFNLASILVMTGSWIRYGGTRASPPSYGAVMVGQILIGLAQPIALSMPTTYSELWFSPRGRVAATAVASLANPLGGALGELINPMFLTAPDQIAQMTLYVSVIATVASLPSFLLPAKPPTPVAASSTTPIRPMLSELRSLVNSRDFWIILSVFSVYVGFFNSLSSLLVQMMTPYGYAEDDASLVGGVLILVGLVAAAISSPIVDKYNCYLLFIRVLTPIIGVMNWVFYWAPPAGTIAAAYVICAILGAAAFSLVPVALETLANVTYPVSPSFSSVICWTGGQILGAVFIIISDALVDNSPTADPPGNLQKALIFQAVVAMAVVPPVYFIGWGGGLKSARLSVDRRESGS